MEPGGFSPAELVRYEDKYSESVRQIEESQSFVKRLIDAQTEEEFEVAIHALETFRQQNPRLAYEAFIGELK